MLPVSSDRKAISARHVRYSEKRKNRTSRKPLTKLKNADFLGSNSLMFFYVALFSFLRVINISRGQKNMSIRYTLLPALSSLAPNSGCTNTLCDSVGMDFVELYDKLTVKQV